ncbi:MAG: hypothetical protein KGL40_00765 [Rhodocyclaceae bacterium]|nr:hypothetical protein [Rhodocyclaceae bacterium]
MAVRIITKGPKNGICNICGEESKLTEDHTPPKGCISVTQVELKHIAARVSADATSERRSVSQNGIKYRTLCARCNNGLLGADYDVGLREFVNKIGDYLKSRMHLPPTLNVPGYPQKIVRAVLGHLSAQGVGRYKKGPQTEALREYMLDTSLPLPEGISIYCWPYPYRGHVVVRDAAFTYLPIGKPCVFWLLKFFPVAFMVTWDQPEELVLEKVVSFDTWRNAPYDYQAEIPVPLMPLIYEYWPEAPTDDSIVVYGPEAITANEFKNPGKAKR